ncbi:hypothetical protein TNCV_1517781 [Trichonephila clavipes]|nr:hypothetical protein TNCV_1517781 [Trichonephila clavipes]
MFKFITVSFNAHLDTSRPRWSIERDTLAKASVMRPLRFTSVTSNLSTVDEECDNFRVSDSSLQWNDVCSDLFHSFSIELRSRDFVGNTLYDEYVLTQSNHRQVQVLWSSIINHKNELGFDRWLLEIDPYA